MIDSYRRAAKYLLDTANHLELVARRNSNKKSNKKEDKTITIKITTILKQPKMANHPKKNQHFNIL